MEKLLWLKNQSSKISLSEKSLKDSNSNWKSCINFCSKIEEIFFINFEYKEFSRFSIFSNGFFFTWNEYN